MFGELLRALRESVSMTQGEIAEIAGISMAYVSALESGRRSAPPQAVVTPFASVLSIDGTADAASTIQADDELSSALAILLDGLFLSIRAADLRSKNPVPLIHSLRLVVKRSGTSSQEANA